MKDNQITIEYKKIVGLERPYAEDGRWVYHAWININEIPKGLPTDVNPREVKEKTNVYRKIENALATDDDSFFVNNRGILLAAKSVKIDSLSKKLTINLGGDTSQYGVLDGGHTYHAIIKNKEKLTDVVQFVHLEIMTSVRNIDELAAARNTSVKVSDKAIAELADKFDFIKESLKNEPYAKDISYKENEAKRLDALDLIRLMYPFNIEKYPMQSNLHPIQALLTKEELKVEIIKAYNRYTNNPIEI